MKTIITLILFLLASPAAATPIETYRLPADGEDWAPAFERAQQACRAPGDIECAVELKKRIYPISRAINVCTPFAVTGVGVGFARSTDGLKPSVSTIQSVRSTVFRTRNKLEGCPFALGVSDHGILNLQHVSLVNYRQARDGDAAFYGIDAKTRIVVSDVGISGFVQGIRLVCGLVNNAGCNESMFANVDVILSEHSGVYLQGDNSNASLFTRVRSDSNCRYASRWNADAIAPLCSRFPAHAVCVNQHYQCAGFQDLSFLGNTYTACAAASESTANPPIVRYAGYVFAGAGQTSMGLGLYSEADSAPQYADRNCNVVGGQSAAWAGPLGQWHGPTMTTLSIVNDVDPVNNTRVDFGRYTNLGSTAMAVTSAGVSSIYPWRLKVNAPSQTLLWDVANTRFVMSMPHLQGNLTVPDTVVVGKTVCSPKTGCVTAP